MDKIRLVELNKLIKLIIRSVTLDSIAFDGSAPIYLLIKISGLPSKC